MTLITPSVSPSSRIWLAVLAFCLTGALGLTAYRMGLALAYGDVGSMPMRSLAEVLVMGVRFDLKVLALVSLLLWLGYSLAGIARRLSRCTASGGAGAAIGAMLAGWPYALGFGLLNFLSVAQHYYFGFYRSTFNTIVFGLVEDDTVALLNTVWHDYPVVRALLAIGLMTSLQVWLWRRLYNACTQRLPAARWRTTAVMRSALAFVVMALLARGSLGTFPLNASDASVTNNPLLNEIVKNAPFALYAAWKDRSQQVNIRAGSLNQQLQALGFHDIGEVAGTLGRRYDPADPPAFVYDHVPARQQERKPHVVFCLMESWSGRLMDFQAPDNDLLGALAPHLRDDILLHKFVSAQSGTHPTLEALLLNSPLSPLTQGDHGRISFDSSAARPFKEQGYRTVFIYGGSNEWRSVGRVMRRQHFDETYDMADIIAANPQAKKNTWGVFDEHLFEFARARLQRAEAAGEPLMLFMLTTTHHPPHSVPPEYRPLPIDWARMAPVSAQAREEGMKMLLTYQYANHHFGRFLDGIKRSPLADHTIVAATGDHNLRVFFRSSLPADLLHLYRVPAYFSIPRGILGNRRIRDGHASHRDLFPTLYHLALPGARYVALGNDLFGDVPEPERFGLINNNVMFSDAGVVTPLDGNWQAFAWNVDGTVRSAQATPLLETQLRRARAVLAAQDWLTRYQVLGAQAGNNGKAAVVKTAD